jgi:hypothetical protein
LHLGAVNAASCGGGWKIAEKRAAFLGKASIAPCNALKAQGDSIMVDRVGRLGDAAATSVLRGRS